MSGGWGSRLERRGLVNLGNTCFMNSVVQLLTGPKDIAVRMLNSNAAVSLGLTKVVQEIISIDESSAYAPSGLLASIYAENCTWVTAYKAEEGKQQCVAEFLTFLIDSIPELQACVEFKLLQPNKKLEPQTILDVALQDYPRMNLESLICFQYPEIRDVNQTLIVVVKRWGRDAHGAIVKNDTGIEVPAIVNIYDSLGGVAASLKLCGVVLHTGNTSDSGHYTAYTMTGQQCLLCDDEAITQVKTEDMLCAAKIGFVLMFQKQEAAGGRHSARLGRREEKQPVTRSEEKQPVIELSDDDEPVPPPVSKTEKAAGVGEKRSFSQTLMRDAAGVLAGFALAVLREKPAPAPAPAKEAPHPLAASYD